MYFYTVPRHFKQSKFKWEVRDQFKQYYWNVRRALSYGFEPRFPELDDGEEPLVPHSFANKQDHVNAIHDAIDEWVERLQGQPLHGGERTPDACDFRLYAEFMRLQTLPFILGIIEARPASCEFVKWYKLMKKACSPAKTF